MQYTAPKFYAIYMTYMYYTIYYFNILCNITSATNNIAEKSFNAHLTQQFMLDHL